jgi:hypothetical protein
LPWPWWDGDLERPSWRLFCGDFNDDWRVLVEIVKVQSPLLDWLIGSFVSPFHLLAAGHTSKHTRSRGPAYR